MFLFVVELNTSFFKKNDQTQYARCFQRVLFISLSEVDEVGTGTTDELEEEPSASQMAGKSPNFCVLLHGSLKVEGMVALVQLG